jgi:hypothetical protein
VTPSADRCSAARDSAGEASAAFARYSGELVTAVEAALGPWIEASIAGRHPGPMTPELTAEAAAAGARARAEVIPRLRDLLALDVDAQWTNPLAIIRTAVVYPNEVLANAGVAPVDRDDYDARINPDDLYDLGPATFADLGPDVHERGLLWGAAKAHVHLRRRRPAQ